MALLEKLRQAGGFVDPIELSRQLVELGAQLRELVKTDWPMASDTEREQAVARLKETVVDQLIPVAGAVSMMGVPGMFVYPPCQLAGALAVTYVRTGKSVLDADILGNVARIVLWNNKGQLVWINVADLAKPIVTAPMAALALIPFVQTWTRAMLDRVDAHYVESRA